MLPEARSSLPRLKRSGVALALLEGGDEDA